MADITMCDDGNCHIKNGCYRYKALPNEHRQSYFAKSPYSKKLKECQSYWPLRAGMVLKDKTIESKTI